MHLSIWVRLLFVSLCALIFSVAAPALLAGPSVATAVAGPGPAAVFAPDDPRLTFEGHWALENTQAISVNSGATLRFRFTGDQLAARFDTASITVPSQLYVTIDGGSPALAKVDRDRIVLADQLDDGVVHTAEIAVKDVDEYENRWIVPLQSGVVLTGLELSPGAQLLPVRRSQAHRLEFYGDSITEGVMALCPVLGVDCADGTKDYAFLVGGAFEANTNQVGFGKQGIIQPGHGNVGAASQSFGWNLAGYPAEPFHPDAVVINFGTNDAPWGSAEFTPRYLAYLRQVRAANPHTEILALRPFNGTHGGDIATAVTQMADPGTSYVDTTAWLTAAGDYNGGSHPSIQGHRKAAARLVEVIEDRLGWSVGAATAPSAALQPQGLERAACADTPLRLTFPEDVRLGTEGRLQVRQANGSVVDTIDLADPATDQRSIGGASRRDC